MTRWPASWAGDSVAARAASGLWAAAECTEALPTPLAEAGAFRTCDPSPAADRCVAELATWSALALTANRTATAAATEMPPILSHCCCCTARIASYNVVSDRAPRVYPSVTPATPFGRVADRGFNLPATHGPIPASSASVP